MRLFFALNFADEVRREVARLTQPLRAAVPGIGWVDAEHLHVTLKFLGERDASEVPTLAVLGKDAVRRHRPHDVALTAVGAFPNLGRPRVVWLGITGGEGLAQVAAALDAGAEALGVAREARPFRPHVTLARVRRPLGAEEAAALALAAAGVRLHVVTSVRVIDLMRSTLTAAGPRYEPVGAFPLGGG